MVCILVIEDNPQTARMVAKLLKRQNYHVETSSTGEEGLLKMADLLPDLVLIDLGLPDIDGQTLIGIIREQPTLNATPMIAFTAWSPVTAREMAKAYGCDGVITKPIDTRLFVKQVEGFLRPPLSEDTTKSTLAEPPQK
jgi:DNA-binding response OmpR family regulator